MRHLKVELYLDEALYASMPDVGEDRPVPLASMSSEELSGREIFVFGFHEGKAGIWRSVSGIDFEVGRHRTVIDEELELLVEISHPGQTARGDIWRAGRRYVLRLTLLGR